MSEMFQKDDVFIVLIRTQKNAEGTRMRAWSGAGVRMSEMFQKDDVFIVLIRTQKNAEGTRMRAWSGAGVRVSEMCTGHHLTTAVAHQPQLRVCFPTMKQKFPLL